MAVKYLEGNVVSQGMKVAIVGARFNEFITSKLISGAIDALVRHDVKEDDITVAWVPGAFEIPVVVQKLAETMPAEEGIKVVLDQEETVY